jgi:hypothetical protein
MASVLRRLANPRILYKYLARTSQRKRRDAIKAMRSGQNGVGCQKAEEV